LRLVIKLSGFSVSFVLLHRWLYDRKDIQPVQTLPAVRLGSLLGDSQKQFYPFKVQKNSYMMLKLLLVSMYFNCMSSFCAWHSDVYVYWV